MLVVWEPEQKWGKLNDFGDLDFFPYKTSKTYYLRTLSVFNSLDQANVN